MTIKTRKELVADIKNRVAAGESKSAIFSRYSMTEWEDAALRIIPVQVTPAKRRRWRALNWALVVCLVELTLVKILDLFFMTDTLNNVGARTGIILLGLAVNVAVLVGVIRYNAFAYLLTCVFVANGLVKVLEMAGKQQFDFAFDLPTAFVVVNMMFCVAAIVLAFILYRRLLPCTTFFFSAKKNALGQPIFED